MPVFINLVGKRFGRLVVTEQVEDHITPGGSHQKQWRCKCDCGNETITTTQNLRSGDTKSCGCYGIECKIKNNTTHGETNTRLHKIWSSMRNRCNNKNDKSYYWYGARGIKVCDQWNKDYTKFRDWSKCSGYSDGLTIDRIDPNGNYEPNNCRWITMKEQNNNRRNNVCYEYGGETHTIAEWADKINVPYSRLYMRLYNGCTIGESLNYNKQ